MIQYIFQVLQYDVRVMKISSFQWSSKQPLFQLLIILFPNALVTLRLNTVTQYFHIGSKRATAITAQHDAPHKHSHIQEELMGSYGQRVLSH